jgi:hypothetical protein
MKISFKLLESQNTIQKNILSALLPDVKNFMVNAANKMRKAIPPVVVSAIENSPEYNALMGGSLQYELGIPDPGPKLAGLIEIWSSNVDVNYQPPTMTNNGIKSSVSVGIIKIDFSDVLYSEYAQNIDTFRGYSLPWLEWLLLDGTQILVKDYEVSLGPYPTSRTGQAIMSASNQSWKIPSEYTGTINDNWITRALNNAGSSIEQAIQGALV